MMEEPTRRTSPLPYPTHPPRLPEMPEEILTDGKVEDTALEDEMMAAEHLPQSLEEVTPLPSEEDEFHLIDYLMGHDPQEQ